MRTNKERFMGRAHCAVQVAVKKGKIARPLKCSRCKKESEKIIAHHTDYSKPFKIKWVCLSCHRYLHPIRGIKPMKKLIRVAIQIIEYVEKQEPNSDLRQAISILRTWL